MAGNHPFSARPVPRGGLLSRVLRRGRTERMAARVHNRFAYSDRLRDVSQGALYRIVGSSAPQVLPRLGPELYAEFLRFCLTDRRLAHDELADLAHLRALFGLRDDEIRQLHDRVAQTAFGEGAEQALEDARLSAEERAFLARLQSELGISDSAAQRVLAVKLAERISQEEPGDAAP